MKRILTLLTVCLMASVAMAQNAGIMVSVNKGEGGLKFFRSNQLMEAIEAAEINDTIYFTAGSFDFNQLPRINDDHYKREWSKPLVVIGAGAQSDNGTSVSMDGTLFLKFDDSIPLEKRNITFEGIYIPNWVSPGSEVNELTFRNYRGEFYDRNDLISAPEDSGETWDKPHTYINNVIVDRCQMNDVNLEERNVDNIRINNTQIHNYLKGQCSERSGQAIYVDHCTMRHVGDSFAGLIRRSFIDYYYAGNNAQLEECGVYTFDDYMSETGCFRIGDWLQSDTNPTEYGLTVSDNTLYGTAGGTTPFTLYPSYPTLDAKNSKIVYFNGTLSIEVSLLGAKNEANEQ